MILPVSMLLAGYRTGFFPMAVHGGIGWFSPEQRGILPLNRFHAPKRLRRVVGQGRFEVSIDRAFDDVIRACASRDDTDEGGNWINDEIIESYCRLHRAGFAHSVEAWHAGELVGGLYGVSLKGAFFGESMFHRSRDASKVALWRLVERLRERHYQLLDIQWLTPHLERLGAIEIPRGRYLELLAESMQVECQFI